MNEVQLHATLGQLRPLAQLGQGGMARVLLCARQGPANIQKLLVVKEIREELANDAEFVTMFMDEARVATRMSHPNLVQTYDVSAEGTHYYMVMEYLEGQPMHAFLGRVKRKLPLAAHLRMLTRILSGLQYAHDLCGFDGQPLQIVHRDVSPQNTILCYDGQVKLVDFGIAKAAGAVSRTTAGMFKGKLGYVAPEQVAGTDIDRRADVFSVGVMLWEALVGRRLTYGENEAAILHKRTTGTQARAIEARPEADAELAAICDKAMEFDPNKRFASAAEMRDAIDARMDALGIRATESDIGKLVVDAFAEERKGIHAIIERQLAVQAKTAADASAVARLPVFVNETGPQSIPPNSGMLPNASGNWTPPTIAGTATSLPIEVTPEFRKSPKRMLAIIGGASALAVVVVVAIVVATSGKDPKPAASNETSAAPPSVQSASATPENGVEVAIDVSTPHAKITVDGKSVGKSPFRATVPKDGRNHEVVVSADGYVPETRTIGFDRDVRLELALKPASSFLGGATHTFPVATAPASNSAGAGTDLRVQQRPKHNIDDKDPY
jgi:serine/threonine-protein kinase